ncbi:MAG TPA: Ppx/GppA phosphatase family protein [Kofleriaceae bacterium]|jgi:exopolyphosphatase/guanosine-5'-triphosphate,3'-diphosphate pyrophosphatase|nr:Ppx/GppA phosphatase family protein [Kofleriaceae bacterium]
MPLGRTTLGAIDAGSNAIRMVIAELGPNELLRIEAERVPVRLGHGAFTRGELDDEVIDQAVRAFVHFRERFDHHGATIYRAVGTSAVRNASNRDVLLHRLYHEAGIELEVIEGEEEARLVRKAVVDALGPTATPPRAILDLGGGSLEVNLRHGTSWRGYSLPVGTVRLLETFGLDGAIAEAEAGMVRRYTATLMHTIARGVSGNGIAAATGGNAEALAKILGDPSAPGPASPGFELAALEKALPALIGASVEDRMAQFGVKRDRAEVLGIAALVFATVARQLGIAKLVTPGVGIREAVLLELAETAREEQAKAEGAHDKALVTAARAFANRVDHDTTHGEHVRQLARQLFHQLRDVHGVPDDRGVVLEVAALLHDVGEVVNVRGHHKHSEYMIRWARIPGLDDTSREMIAVLARTHRKDAARAKQIIGESTLPKDHRAQLRKLSGLLRIADALDSEHRSRVEQIVCTRMGDAIVLDLVVRDGPSRDDGQLLRKSDLLTEELGMAIKITVARPVAPPTEATGRDATGRGAAAEAAGKAKGQDAGGKVVALRAKAT